MAQQNMDFNEGYRAQQQYQSNEGTPESTEYAGSYYQAPAQKVSANARKAETSASLGGRIAVAICSLVFLIPLSAITLSNSGLVAFGMVCLTVILINIAFNIRSWSH